MQKFNGKLKNTPRGTPQASCSVNPLLNREETLSVEDKVLPLNNPDVDLRQHRAGFGPDSGRSLQNTVYVEDGGWQLITASRLFFF